jgi:hypothetical protein
MRLKRDKLDAAFSDFIRWRDGWRCRRCRASHNPPAVEIQCAHIYTRGNKGIRVDEDNAIALCDRCHFYFKYREQEWRDWCLKHFGAEYIERLKFKYYARGRKLVASEKELLRQDFIKRTLALEAAV